MTAAKMVLHDWQRGRIPFFVPPPRQQEDDSLEEPNADGINEETAGDDNQASAAFRAIVNVISSQQQKNVPVQRDLFSENELRGDGANQCLTAECEKREQPSGTDDEMDDELPNEGDKTNEKVEATES
ncbi:hypothetical protein MANES_04G058628v8 [Manihot esculenta]|nr:hypothetical protein MANES_04G058628v8 [Manihot esculenta]